MKRIGLKGLTLAVVAFLALSLNSCKKEEITKTHKGDQVALDSEAALQRFDAVYAQSMQYVFDLVNDGKSFKTSSIATCADITVDTVNLPYTITINFGPGCVDENGDYFSGSLHAEFNEKETMRTTGAYMNVTFTNLVQDSVEVNGSFSFTNNGLNGNNNLTFDIDFNMDLEHIGTHETASMNGNTAYEFVAGQQTETDEDDLLALSGQLGGVIYGSTNVTLTILDPLIKSRAVGCDENFIQGQLKIEQTGEADKYIDYGNGTCDDQATETVNGQSNQITLDGGF